VYFAKTADLIQMPFGVKGQVGTINHVLHGSPEPPQPGANFAVEMWWCSVMYRENVAPVM